VADVPGMSAIQIGDPVVLVISVETDYRTLHGDTLLMRDMKSQNRGSAASSYTLSILRIVTGLLFICHGLQKLFGMFGGHRVPLNAILTSLFGVAGLLETIGGTLIILGLFTRPVAFILCGEMAVAYFKAHFPSGPIPLVNHGEIAVLNCFVFLHLIFAGAGPISLDRILRGKN
jgi:putative oxidoreductase